MAALVALCYPALQEDRVERRLSAIMVADMVGFSRLMEIDETGT